ncbi:ABC transporter substrate-binding protein [Sodalis ligni]|jgi:branched-chain amino acid transport system substrate-binding protein|uniref:Amino acid/amide ABC transporter substrate-binding protein (HAAT family) n=1 Tax=Sodalis ligni TaxID=2697027 RepID=A0A4R1NBD8_9GAMM|nr:ABC transporter substrate-binding protein [Sodalis ligni]TCL04632.1 amino acid/amide ABC transporter substrate-binding protein (HAAT family) [Sodalis ligni]
MRLIFIAVLSVFTLMAEAAIAAGPVRLGVTTILSGPNADRGQSERNGIELALKHINMNGGVLGRSVEAVYVDNAADATKGVEAARQLIEKDHVSVLIGALATPVTRAIMPVANAARVPLVIDISAGQEFVDAAGVGGFDYIFKTSPSDWDVAIGMMQWLKAHNVGTIAILSDSDVFNQANAAAMAKAAKEVGIKTIATEVIPAGEVELSASLQRLEGARPDRIVTLLGRSNQSFFKAYEKSAASIPISGRIDFNAALNTFTPAFINSGRFDQAIGISVFTPAVATGGLAAFIQNYRQQYGIAPTQRSIFAYEAALLIVDAVRRAGNDNPADIQKAIKSTDMASLLGGDFTMDIHNHSHTHLQIVGLRDGKITLIDSVTNSTP